MCIKQAYTASSLSDKVKFWQDINAPAHVLDWISNGVKIPFRETPCDFHLPNRSFSFGHGEFVAEELDALVKSGAIIKQNHPPKCISPIGVVPKRGGKLRLIVDLRGINRHCEVPKFQYDDIDTVAQYIATNDLIVTLDLKNGFHHIPVCMQHQQYLGIYFRNQYYVWAVLPFGLSSSPYYFCKSLKPVINYLRDVQGLKVSSYMDDIILLGQDNINAHTKLLVTTLEKLGWIINYDKSSLTPSFEKEYIGYKISTHGTPVLKVPSDRVKKLKRDIKRALTKDTISARVLARIAGQCVSMTRAVLPGKLLLRDTYRCLSNRKHWDDILHLNTATRSELLWWAEALQSWNGAPICKSPITCQIATDASQTGWGAICHNTGKTAAGYWNKDLSQQPSNYREMMAVLLSLHSFKHLQKQHVQVLTDNITTAAYINHLGGSSQLLSPLAESIWMYAYQNNITLTARYLPGKCNTSADALSRLPNIYEWRLHPQFFQFLSNMWGPFTIDRFATFMNAQTPYNSQHADPQSAGTDALAQQDWSTHLNFVNAPFRLLPRILQIVEAQQAHATVIAPHWPGQPWYQTIRKMACSPPIRVPKWHAMSHMGVTPEPLKNPKWRILAWNICGQNHCTHGVGRKEQ
jgi:hypothetical protein